MLSTGYSSPDVCPGFYMAENVSDLGAVAVKVIGTAPERAVLASGDGRLAFGNVTGLASFEQGPVVAPETFRLAGTPRTGDAGLEELVAQRVLRVATDRDVEQWQALARSRDQSGQARFATFDHHDLNGNPVRTFVVLAPMQFPAGLFGAHPAPG